MPVDHVVKEGKGSRERRGQSPLPRGQGRGQNEKRAGRRNRQRPEGKDEALSGYETLQPGEAKAPDGGEDAVDLAIN